MVPKLCESLLLSPAGREFSQPSNRSFAQPCRWYCICMIMTAVVLFRVALIDRGSRVNNPRKLASSSFRHERPSRHLHKQHRLYFFSHAACTELMANNWREALKHFAARSLIVRYRDRWSKKCILGCVILYPGRLLPSGEFTQPRKSFLSSICVFFYELP